MDVHEVPLYIPYREILLTSWALHLAALPSSVRRPYTSDPALIRLRGQVPPSWDLAMLPTPWFLLCWSRGPLSQITPLGDPRFPASRCFWLMT
jgi:hypothetical protein